MAVRSLLVWSIGLGFTNHIGFVGTGIYKPYRFSRKDWSYINMWKPRQHPSYFTINSGVTYVNSIPISTGLWKSSTHSPYSSGITVGSVVGASAQTKHSFGVMSFTLYQTHLYHPSCTACSHFLFVVGLKPELPHGASVGVSSRCRYRCLGHKCGILIQL